VESHAAKERHVHIAPVADARATSGWSLLLMSVQARLMLAGLAIGLVWAAALWALS
jgi:hypothetical protein